MLRRIFIALLLLVVILIALPTGASAQHEYTKLSISLESKYALPPGLLGAICQRESGWRNVKGVAGEIGICQIKPATVRHAFPKDSPGPVEERLWNQAINLEYAARYLHWLSVLLKTKDPMVLAAAYNGGPGNITVRYMMGIKAQLSTTGVKE